MLGKLRKTFPTTLCRILSLPAGVPTCPFSTKERLSGKRKNRPEHVFPGGSGIRMFNAPRFHLILRWNYLFFVFAFYLKRTISRIPSIVPSVSLTWSDLVQPRTLLQVAVNLLNVVQYLRRHKRARS